MSLTLRRVAQQDALAGESVRRAVAASDSGAFAQEITSGPIKDHQGERVIDKDETPYTCDINKIPRLRAAFSKTKTDTVTATTISLALV